ncbi:MAG: hypothetical protein M3N41_14875 [Acidobacteriota bacterium]|nr:hypothetical protein [Acidobacteriota bacterium]
MLLIQQFITERARHSEKRRGQQLDRHPNEKLFGLQLHYYDQRGPIYCCLALKPAARKRGMPWDLRLLNLSNELSPARAKQ